MIHTILPPREPGQHEPVRPPMIYIEKPLKWEYKQIVRDLETEELLDENDLNALGEEGWEMTGIAQHTSKTYFYFKRQIEK